MLNASRFLPFLRWFPLTSTNLKLDFLAGITVALVLIPQSMAYAQLAGMPAYYGLYAAFLPGIIAAMWGSSSQLSTGPVAVVSLLTASTLAPLAAAGTAQFIALAILMALMVGIIQLGLGIFKLGVIVNFLSHPVVVGFTNAAAIIIALSQLNKVLGVSMGRSEHFAQDFWGVLQQIGELHLPTLLMGCSAFALMWGMKRYTPKLPGVLAAVVLATVISWYIGFEHNEKGKVEGIVDNGVKTLANNFASTEIKIEELTITLSTKSSDLKLRKKVANIDRQRIAALSYEIELLQLEIKEAAELNRNISRSLRKFIFEQVPASQTQAAKLYLSGQVPKEEVPDGYRWRIKKISKGELNLIGGGEVVGSVPAGLPDINVPAFSWDMLTSLLSGALVIALVGFMEAVSMAKAMAAKTKDKINPNQELIGQGLGNIVGSFSQAYPSSGSFSRSAVNLNAGAKTGMSSVFAGLFVVLTLLFLTPLLYHLPQAVLAAVIMMAVTGLINFKAIKHAWQTHTHDGIAAIVTFVATLALAPHLDQGIVIGAGIAIILYLYRTMKPRVAILGRHQDGTLRDAKLHNLPMSDYVIAIRYDGSLYFANVSYFEDTVLEAVSKNHLAKHILIMANGINQLDASGDEVIHHLVERLRSNNIRIVFCGVKKQVLNVMDRSGLTKLIGNENIFADENAALESIYTEVRKTKPDAQCRLMKK